MAISQERYVSIKSTNVGDSAVTNRELGGLVFTLGKGWKKTDEPWDDGSIVVIHNSTQAKSYFTSGSDEMKEAERYFSYVSPSGTAPATLTYVRMSVKTQTDGADVYSIESSFKKVGSSTVSGVTVNSETFFTKVGKKNAKYTFEYQNTSWTYGGVAVTMSDYGITVTGDPASGDVITLVASNQLVWKKVGTSDPAWYKLGDDTTAVSAPVIEEPKEVLKRVNDDTNNFGSYTYTDIEQFTCKQFKEVAIVNCGFNYKYLFSVACLDSATTTAADAVLMNAVSTASFKSYLKASEGDVDDEFLTDEGIKGTMVINGCDKFSATMPMAIFASTDYYGVNTATYFMFKQFAGETATVTSDEIADAFDKANINYYGLVQVNGQRKSFFQTGVNSDGENAAVYCNEIWLKSSISTAIMNLFLTTEKIPANEDGELMIYGILMSAAEQGIRNGMIIRGKTLTDVQKTKIYQLTGDSEAWFTVQDTGYVGSVEIRQVNNKYVAFYKLIYSKGDAICKVEGSDVLI